MTESTNSSQTYYQANIEQYYENPDEDLLQNGVLIEGLTREDVSEYITRFPFIYQLYKKNAPAFQEKLIEGLMRAPTPSDCPGFIYGFINERENGLLEVPFWIKMGRTKRDQPQKRIYEWQKDDNIKYTEIFTLRSKYASKLQFLVHTLFAYGRQPRIINGRTRKEWFHFQEITLTSAAVSILNHIMNILHTTTKIKSISYNNSQLHDLNSKLYFSNCQIDGLLEKLQTTKKMSASIARDLGIQMSQSPLQKHQLAEATKFEQIKETLSSFCVGRQLQEMLVSVTKAATNAKSYVQKLEFFKEKILEDLKKIQENTKVQYYTHDIPVKKGISPNKKEPSSNKKIFSEEKVSSEQKISNTTQNKEQRKITTYIGDQEFIELDEKEHYKMTNHVQKYKKSKNYKDETTNMLQLSKENGSATIKDAKDSKNVKRQHGKLKFQRMSQIEEYAQKNKISQIMNMSETFIFDTDIVKTDKMIVIITKKVIFENTVNFIKDLKKLQIRVFCQIMQNQEHVQVNHQCAKDIFFYQVPDRDLIIPLDVYHMDHVEIDETAKVFANKLRRMCD